MIVELASREFSRALPPYHLTEFRFPLISAVLDGSQRGQVFADDREQPRSALVVNNFGFMFYIGEQVNPDFDLALSKLFENGSGIKPSYLLWYSPPSNWQQRLDSLGARRRERVRFEFRADVNEAITCPSGFELRKLDAELIPKTKKFNLDIDSRFWSSAEDVEQNALGFCLIKDNEIVTLCYAAAVSERLAEVDVVTDEAFRRQQLAKIVSERFIRECRDREITPTWDCFDYNTASLRLALALKFTEVRRYPFYSFNVPLATKSTNETRMRQKDGL